LPGRTPGGNALPGLRNYGGRSRRVFFYWAKRASPEIADRIIDKFTDRFWLLGEHPDAGKASEGIAAGLKCFSAGKYLIYYRAMRRGTDILHVFHGARHQRKAFKKARETR
jgi:plasmid stabilization system protein ParE